MKMNTKLLTLGVIFSLALSPNLLAAESATNMAAVQEMEVKLANLEVDITKKKVELWKRQEKLNEMKLKALQNKKIDQKNIALKLAEVESALAKDKLLLSKREVKLYEMKVSLLKHK